MFQLLRNSVGSALLNAPRSMLGRAFQARPRRQVGRNCPATKNYLRLAHVATAQKLLRVIYCVLESNVSGWIRMLKKHYFDPLTASARYGARLIVSDQLREEDDVKSCLGAKP